MVSSGLLVRGLLVVVVAMVVVVVLAVVVVMAVEVLFLYLGSYAGIAHACVCTTQQQVKGHARSCKIADVRMTRAQSGPLDFLRKFFQPQHV